MKFRKKIIWDLISASTMLFRISAMKEKALFQIRVGYNSQTCHFIQFSSD